jgi:hypothetical protein
MSNLVPEGRYIAIGSPVEIEGARVWAQFGKSPEKGTPQVVVAVEILEGEESGRVLTWFGYFTDKTADRTLEALRFLGFKGEDLTTLPSQPLDQKVEIIVRHEDYNGKTQARIAWINRPGGGGFKLDKPMPANDLRMFAASLKGRLAKVPEVKGERGVPGATPPPASESQREPARPDDDIPF